VLPWEPLRGAGHAVSGGMARKPIDDMTEKEFLSDLMRFLEANGQYSVLPTVGGVDDFPTRTIAGKRVDLWNLYRAVVSKGGFRMGAALKRVDQSKRLNWTGHVFPSMRNFVQGKGSAIGHDLATLYRLYLADYEVAHPEDVEGAEFIRCDAKGAGLPPMGSWVEVYWKGDKVWYSGQVDAAGATPTRAYVAYDDGDYDEVDFHREPVRVLPAAPGTAPIPARRKKRQREAALGRAGSDEYDSDSLPSPTTPLEPSGRRAAEALFGLHYSRGAYWDDWRVGEWLEERGFGDYVDKFEEHEVTMDTLPLLTDEDLAEMEVADNKVRRAMLACFASAPAQEVGDHKAKRKMLARFAPAP